MLPQNQKDIPAISDFCFFLGSSDRWVSTVSCSEMGVSLSSSKFCRDTPTAIEQRRQAERHSLLITWGSCLEVCLKYMFMFTLLNSLLTGNDHTYTYHNHKMVTRTLIVFRKEPHFHLLYSENGYTYTDCIQGITTHTLIVFWESPHTQSLYSGNSHTNCIWEMTSLKLTVSRKPPHLHRLY